MNTLKEQRLQKGISMQVIASYLSISRGFYCQIEGNTRRLSYENAVKIAKFFKTKPDKLFYKDFDEKLKNERKKVGTE